MTSVLPEDAQARCKGCGYSLQALTEPRCPECGRGFDPKHRATYGETKSWVSRALAKPPGPALHVAAFGAAMFGLAYDLMPGGILPFALLSFVIWLCVATTWFVRFVSWCVVTFGAGPAPWRTWRSWSVAPAVFALMILLLWTHGPLRLTFAVSRPAMERMAQQALRSGNSKFPNQQMGVFPATNIERFPEGVRFIVQGGCLIDMYGFAYCPKTPPTNEGDHRYTPSAGKWYLYILMF